MNLFTGIAAVAAATLALAGQGNVQKLCKGFVEENDLWISTDMKSAAGGITEAQFNAVIDKVTAIYGQVVTDAGGNLKVQRNWDDGTVNAYAERVGGDWVIQMFGGLARHQTITEDGFALVVCHELGHHIGGAPKYKSFWGEEDWASNEGQSDYFAGLKCLRRYFADQDNATFLADKELDPLVVKNCDSEHAVEADKLICARIALAGQSVANLFQELRNESKAPRFDTPDPKVQKKTLDAHPPTQCRMDTYFQGGVCAVDVSQDVDQKDYKVGSCIKATHNLGLRPLCWFAPN